VFGNDDVDNAVNTCRSNEAFWHDKDDKARGVWELLCNLHDNFRASLTDDLPKIINKLEELADKMRANYLKVVEIRKVDTNCWIAARTLLYHVATNTEFTSRDDALRHVIKLLQTTNKTIDADADVVRLKEEMERKITEKLGEEKAAELHREKTYLAKPNDVDF
jgi:methionyl-tRNA synthetase